MMAMQFHMSGLSQYDCTSPWGASDPLGLVSLNSSNGISSRQISVQLPAFRTFTRLCRKQVAVCEHSNAGSASGFNQDVGSVEHTQVSNLSLKHRNVSIPAAVATASRPAYDEEDVKPWRLDDKLHELKVLKNALVNLDTWHQKLDVLNTNRRVRLVFGKSNAAVNPLVSVALQSLDEHEMYLLKCLVAAGQEHVLEAHPAWLEQLPTNLQKATTSLHDRMGDSYSKSQSSRLHDSNEENGNAKSLKETHLHSKSFPDMHTNGLLGKEKVNGSARVEHAFNQESRGLQADLHIEAAKSLLGKLIKILEDMESFYDSIGGIIGYQVAALELIKAADVKHDDFSLKQMSGVSLSDSIGATRFFVPTGPDLSKDKDYAAQAAVWGLQALPEMGEIYPLGGAGDRLGLVDDVTGECLPVAMLPYCGRTLLEGLIRDLQAREYLHFRIFGKQCITPVAIMTSAAKKNNELVTGLCESREWFGRGRSSFFLFEQPLIPTVGAEYGNWLIMEPLVPILKPGGHGVIWKLALDKGVFNWFYKKGRKAAIVRQISNPIAATDVTLLALTGVGHRHNKKFGFASCERKVGAAEGVNVLIERRTKDGWEYSVTCIEYTEFNKLGIPDVPVSPGSMQAQYPANTNVLYVDLSSVQQVASARSAASLPGMILNLKKPIEFKDYLGTAHRTYAGRLECTMQNVADFLPNKYRSRLSSSQHGDLDTFLIYNQRRKVTSSAKRRRKPNDSSLHQTPDGSFLDVIWNAHELLSSCMVDMPEMESKECYVESGPPFIALLHPALGPLWDVMRQKIHGGSISQGSELQLEIAEVLWQDVQLDGSLRILADNIVGSMKTSKTGESIMHYGEGCGRCRLQRVQVRNRGVDWSCKKNVYWQHKVQRLEVLQIILHGSSEFDAYDVNLQGSHTFEVPDGYKMTVTEGVNGISCVLDRLPASSLAYGSWRWNHTIKEGHVVLSLQQP